MEKFVICALISCNLLAISLKTYDIDDLIVLNKEKNYKEFLDHAKDIRPKFRDEKWHRMLQNMAVLFIKNKIKKNKIDLTSFIYIEQLSRWPSLKKNKFFHMMRNEYGVLFFQNCFKISDRNKCYKRLESFWAASQYKIFLGIELAKILTDHMKDDPSLDLFPYIKEDLITKDSFFHCQKSYIQHIYIDHLTRKINSTKDIRSLIENSSHKKCWPHIEEHLLKLLFTSNNHRSETIYRLLSSKLSLNKIDEDTYLVLYILKGPLVGHVFNLAWKRIEILKQNYKRRMSVFKRLQEFDPLPGQIFQTPNLIKRITLIDFLSKNFPEYLDYYARTCVDYLEGIKVYPYGNPTIECNDLFQSDDQHHFIDQGIHLRYSSLKK